MNEFQFCFFVTGCNFAAVRERRMRYPTLGAIFLAILISQTSAQTLYSIGAPTNDEQFMLELTNRARADTAAEAARLGLSSNQEGPPSVNGQPWTIPASAQPLSWNSNLQTAAQNHADELNNGDQFFSGQSPHTFGGKTPDQRIADAGYVAAPYTGPTSGGSFPGPENVAEEVSFGSGAYTGTRLTTSVNNAHTGLFTDNGSTGGNIVPGRGHRDTMTLTFFREMGIGISTGTDFGQNMTWDSLYIVQNYGTQNATPFVTGVVYQDTNGNGFYDPGEGIAGVRVDIAGANYYAVTSSSGGYSVPVPGNGTFTVTFSGGGVTTMQKSVTVSGLLNAKSDYVPGAVVTPTVLANISTRLLVPTGDNALIGGFIVTGNATKKIMLRAIGPSLATAGQLADPFLELHDSTGALLESNDNWKDSPNKQAIIDSTIPPTNDLESAIVRSVTPGNYTAIVRGMNDGTGVGLVEIYDLDTAADSKLANISTRGLVQTGNNVLIGGTIIVGQASQKVIIRALGPSLANSGVQGVLADPNLELHNSNGALLESNDNWKDSPNKQAIIDSTIPPTNDAESAIVRTLTPGNYTAIVSGVNNTTGVGLVEVYALAN